MNLSIRATQPSCGERDRERDLRGMVETTT